MAELDELKFLERWFLILTNSCLVVIPMYDVLLSQKLVYETTFEQRMADRGNSKLKNGIILKP